MNESYGPPGQDFHLQNLILACRRLARSKKYRSKMARLKMYRSKKSLFENGPLENNLFENGPFENGPFEIPYETGVCHGRGVF